MEELSGKELMKLWYMIETDMQKIARKMVQEPVKSQRLLLTWHWLVLERRRLTIWREVILWTAAQGMNILFELIGSYYGSQDQDEVYQQVMQEIALKDALLELLEIEIRDHCELDFIWKRTIWQTVKQSMSDAQNMLSNCY